MADTQFATSISRAWLYQQDQATIPIRSENWQVRTIFRLRRPTTEPWGVLCSFTADIESGAVGDMRIRSSAGQDVSPMARVEGFVGPVLLSIPTLNWSGQTSQFLYLEGRRSGGLGGLNLVETPAAVLMSAMPSQYRTTPIYPGDYTGGTGEGGTYPPDYTTDPYT